MHEYKSVFCDNLAPLLLLDKGMEPTPEPFRMQGKVLLLVSFTEYVKFIDKYLDKVDYLPTQTHLLKQYARQGDNVKLYQSFLRSMAIAVTKELHYAEAAKKDATFIMHTVENADVKSASEIEKMYVGVRSYTTAQLYDYMEKNDFALPKTFRKNNQILWYYANSLLFFAQAPGKAWVFNKEELLSNE